MSEISPSEIRKGTRSRTCRRRCTKKSSTSKSAVSHKSTQEKPIVSTARRQVREGLALQMTNELQPVQGHRTQNDDGDQHSSDPKPQQVVVYPVGGLQVAPDCLLGGLKSNSVHKHHLGAALPALPLTVELRGQHRVQGVAQRVHPVEPLPPDRDLRSGDGKPASQDHQHGVRRANHLGHGLAGHHDHQHHPQEGGKHHVQEEHEHPEEEPPPVVVQAHQPVEDETKHAAAEREVRQLDDPQHQPIQRGGVCVHGALAVEHRALRGDQGHHLIHAHDAEEDQRDELRGDGLEHPRLVGGVHLQEGQP
eukprot:RCo001497